MKPLIFLRGLNSKIQKIKPRDLLLFAIFVVLIIAGTIGAQDLYDYFTINPGEIIVSTVEQYAIDEIFIKKREFGWQSHVFAIHITGEEISEHPGSSSNVRELVNFKGESIQEVFSKAATWIKITRSK
jgi:hypothetical protein